MESCSKFHHDPIIIHCNISKKRLNHSASIPIKKIRIARKLAELCCRKGLGFGNFANISIYKLFHVTIFSWRIRKVPCPKQDFFQNFKILLNVNLNVTYSTMHFDTRIFGTKSFSF